MDSTFRSIGLVGKYGDPRAGDTLRPLADYLARRGHAITLDLITAETNPQLRLPAANMATIARDCDLCIVVGGDGTLLHAARELAGHDVPLIGINLGRLGFLVDVSPETMTDTLDRMLAGEYQEEQRFLLHMVLERGGEHHPCSTSVLNDVVIHKWNTARMIEYETFINGRFVHRQRADGLVVSTPTGSTAYALSAGGPILHPSVNAILLVPICPHTLSNRPYVVDGDSEIEVKICEHDHEHARITCDGDACVGLKPGSRVLIRRHDHGIRILHPQQHDHFQIMRTKLHWSEEL